MVRLGALIALWIPCHAHGVAGPCPSVDARVAQHARSLTQFAPGRCEDLPPASQRDCQEGRSLFASVALSSDGAVSCATCHDPSSHFRDGRARPRARGKTLAVPRTPSLVDVGRVEGPFFWNGRAPSLAGQIFWPLYAPGELAATDATLAPHGGAHAVVDKLAAYLSTLATDPAPFDAYVAGECDALSLRERAGLHVLFSRGCITCHAGKEFRGAATVALRYGELPSDVFRDSEPSYSADLELSSTPGMQRPFLSPRSPSATHLPIGTHRATRRGDLRGTRSATLGSLPQSLRNLPARGAPWGRYGTHGNLEAYLVAHGDQPADPAKRFALTEDERRDLLSFLLVGLRSSGVK